LGSSSSGELFEVSPCILAANGSHSQSSSLTMYEGIGLGLLGLKDARAFLPFGGGEDTIFGGSSDHARSTWNFNAPRKRFNTVRKKRARIVPKYPAAVVVVHSIKKSVMRVFVEKIVDILMPAIASDGVDDWLEFI
jgi:hypothetical protein